MASAAVNGREAKPKSEPKGKQDEVVASCVALQEAETNDTQKIAGLTVEIANSYYKNALSQARLSFYAALLVALVGTVLFFWAARLVMIKSDLSSATLTAIGAGLTQVISGVMFYLYNNAAKHCTAFHFCLERISRFMITNSICENLTGEKREVMRSELIRVMADAPLLTFAIFDDTRPPAAKGTRVQKRTQDRAETFLTGAELGIASRPAPHASRET